MANKFVSMKAARMDGGYRRVAVYRLRRERLAAAKLKLEWLSMKEERLLLEKAKTKYNIHRSRQVGSIWQWNRDLIEMDGEIVETEKRMVEAKEKIKIMKTQMKAVMEEISGLPEVVITNREEYKAVKKINYSGKLKVVRSAALKDPVLKKLLGKNNISYLRN